ncbi:MAG: leucine dehydrogenase [Chitinophagales bacterium]|jgi:leucine dehydrogenase|nr:leucine dehydrogenase [Chitinophagales bacterium]
MNIAQTNLFEILQNSEHEQVTFCHDHELGLKAIIAIHNTVLGPSLGGTRVWAYEDESKALEDVLRLSRGMTFKSSISGINLGGGKAVIIADKDTKRDEFFWRRYGQFVDKLSGKYITAEDVGTSPREIEYIAMETQYVSGKPLHIGGSGDPSPFTAYGVYISMKSSWKKITGKESLSNTKILVQGVGHVGQFLVDHLIQEGAAVFVSDINLQNLKKVSDKHKVTIVDPKEVIGFECDIFSPCALGAILNPESIALLKCQLICGAANNQLKEEQRDGDELVKRQITYAPDFLINAGGVINCYTEVIGTYSKERTISLIDPIYDLLSEIFDKANMLKVNPQIAAIKMAEDRIQKANIIRNKL